MEGLTIGCTTYQDSKSLKRMLDSSAPHVYEVLVIDGPFTDFGNEGNVSTDGTLDVCGDYDNVRYIPYPATQVEKRNKYLEECKTDFLLILDSDEWIEGNWEEFYKNLQWVRETRNPDQYCWGVWGDPNHPRVIYKPTEMEYYERHFILKRKDAEYMPDQFQPTGIPSGVIPPIIIKTDDSLRSPEWVQWVDDYQKKLFVKEGVKQWFQRAVWKAKQQAQK